MSNPFLGEVRPFAGGFTPQSWAFCNGQLLSIAQNAALFSLLGTTYGGDGVTTFALPNLQGRLAIHQGQGPGLSNYALGQVSGSENVTLLQTQIPSHNHVFNASSVTAVMPGGQTPGATLLPAPPSVAAPNGNFFTDPTQSNPPAPTLTSLSANSCSMTGGSQPHSNLMPSLCITYIIALAGIFPSRN